MKLWGGVWGRGWLCATAAACLVYSQGVAAAPLEEKNRQGLEALQVLREHGLLQGYEGGQLKGDRSMTRWELAAVLARFLAAVQNRENLLLSKSELALVQSAVKDLQAELSGLGLRTQNLEEQVDRLDQRVTERERIRFKGQFIASLNAMSFSNTGQGRGGNGSTALDYGSVVGSTVASNLVPHGASGILPVVDLIRGRPLVNGTGYSSTLYLDVETEAASGWLVDARFYAYSAGGNNVVNQVWGAPAPYLSNSFTGGAVTDHSPFTNMGIDRVTLLHEESGTTVTLGTFRPRFISPQVYTGQVNPSVGDPRFLESYGIHATGEAKLSKDSSLGWEAFGTLLPDGNPVQLGLQPYRDEGFGGALSYKWGGFTANASFLRAASQSSEGQPLVTGLSNLVNGGTGQVNLNWVNPPQYFAAQLATSGSAGIGSTSDKRPIPGTANSDQAGTKAGFGPQGITLGGAQLSYVGEGWNLRGEYDHSSYKSNRNSSYTAQGDLFGAGGGVQLLDSKLSLDVDYRHTDPTYDPMILVYPGTAAGLDPFRVYHRFPDFSEFWSLYSLHDTVQYTHNREGFVLGAKWAYDEESSLKLSYKTQTQVRTSLQDVRYDANELGPGLPNVKVLGFSPGFFDMVFREYSPLSFDAKLNPLEDQRGSVHSFSVDWHHQFGESPFDFEARYEQYHFFRPSVLSAGQGGSQNLVDLVAAVAHARLGYRASKEWGLGIGYEYGAQRGHYDPFGVYNSYAISNSDTTFRNRDSLQHQPFLDTTYNFSENLKLRGDFHLYKEIDRVPATVYAGMPGGPTSTAHPFAFDGYSIATRLEINF